ncbi:hypothetical protein ACQ4LE_005023 [Meloidogyne hapla]|uniref:7TM_GPCR_Srx domain-containing protein n=1 Tax=Meloidogyne hapla TaxID=6305 RepID=A0A1I8BD15_MELHA
MNENNIQMRNNSLTFILMEIVNVLLDSFGVILFGIIVWVTLKYKNLYISNCHCLIGVYCLCGFFTKFNTILSATLEISGIQAFICGFIYLPAAAIMHGIFPFMLAIGIDRLLSIVTPIW